MRFRNKIRMTNSNNPVHSILCYKNVAFYIQYIKVVNMFIPVILVGFSKKPLLIPFS